MKPTAEWHDWEELWRGARRSRAELDAMIERAKRVRRSVRVMRVLPGALAFIAIGVVASALRHAGNIFELTLGAVVAIGIGAVWLIDLGNQRREGDHVEAPAEEYAAARRALCLRQIRFANLALSVTALDLVFLVPWWIGGFKIHGAGFHVAQLLTLWGPLALMIAVAWWALIIRRNATRELSAASLSQE